MIQHYKRKTKRQSWCKNSVQKAIEAVRTKEMGYVKASLTFNVPKSTLESRVKNKNKRLKSDAKGFGFKMPVFSSAMEMISRPKIHH